MPLVEALISIVAPHDCVICGKEGFTLCNTCQAFEINTVPSRCYRCHKATSDYSVCLTCRRKTGLKHVWVRTPYDETSSKLVLSFKFERARSAYKPLSRAILDVLPVLPADTLIVGVPTVTSRVRQRGYDHIKLLVRQIANKTGLIYVSPVVRSGQAHQFGASRTKRREQLLNAFCVANPLLVKDKRILLVDDVLTTGATLETLAEVLKNAGAKQVDAVVFAQKV